MVSNDINIDFDNISSSIRKINKSMDNIIALTNGMINNANYVNQHFDTINFRNTLEKLLEIRSKVYNSSEMVNRIDKFMKNLEEANRSYKNSNAGGY